MTRALPTSARRFAGGKGAQLTELRAAGFPVPAFGIVGSDAFEAQLATGDLAAEIAAELRELTAARAAGAAEAIAQLINAAPLCRQAAEAIEAAITATHPATHVAVRSSAAEEDGAAHSFAGQGESFLHVPVAGVHASVRACWASAYSERALRYRLLHGLETQAITTAVVIQAMLPSELSGVAFTADPVSGDPEQIVISAVYGLGEGLVSGLVDADTLSLARSGGRTLHRALGSKAQRVDADPSGGVRIHEVDAAEQARLALSDEQLRQIHALALRAEAHAGGIPQDVEWAIAGGEVWLLQARPITGTPRVQGGALRVWDNANIVENFGDVTAPLTASVATHVYGRVYLDYCRVLGVPPRLLPMLEPHTRRLLGSFDGRLYYNVLNWYMVLALVPGASIQRKVLAATAGVRETDPELAAAQRPFAALGPRRERLLHVRTGIVFTWRFLTAQRTVDRFMDEFGELYGSFNAAQLEQLDAAEAWETYERFEQQLLDHWGPTAVLDAVISLTVGVLYGLTERWLPGAPPWLLWQAIKVDDAGLESALPADRLKALAAEVRGDAALAELVAATDAPGLPAALLASDLDRAGWLLGELEHYVEDFGDRAANELKLEEPDLRDDPTPAWAMLADAVRAPATNAHAAAHGEAQDADAWLRGRLSWPQRLAYGAVRRKAQATLRSRERVRFARSRGFGMARRMLRLVGQRLADQGVLTDAEQVHFLRLEELRGVFAGTVDPGELLPIAELRAQRVAAQRQLAGPPPRFLTRGIPATAAKASDPAASDGEAGSDDDRVLRGLPSCPGVVEGEARVVAEPTDVRGGVLVAQRTDPGWIGALASASALVIERGSPLTHVAVVARELGIPTAVQVPGATARLHSGMRVRVDGGAGTVEILDPEEVR